MNPIAYFKLQAKNLFRDYKTKTPYIDNVDGNSYYGYNPKYFDIDRILLECDGILHDCHWDETSLSLMQIQHIFAQMLGFRKWADLLKASEVELELARLLFDNQEKISLEDWEMYIAGVEDDNNTSFTPDDRLEIFKQVFLNVEGHENPFGDYRLNPNRFHVTKSKKPRQVQKSKPKVQITSLPLSKTDRVDFIETANSVFDTVMRRMEPRNPELTHKLWDVEDYVNTLLTEDMLPISKSYALSLIDAFLVHHVLGLTMQADQMAG